ncbi:MULTISPECIES: hypothetical protein [Virgibacillus]|uniref:Phr family secreted Rap phosphatase inhibitor n=1 Tax=Virgibacillus dokdonensis TaxID=302167 RepID=A0A2K9IZE5_9BACI|nr:MULTISPECIES: hypothetical protein [Virgibacillus]AUJ25077.1 hypothetical protein A21D_01996 [Virgibacillus dokdonensis]NWO12708.1 hypothetical protein [Virgibacillus sp.]
MKKTIVSFTCGALLIGGILFTSNVQNEDKLAVSADVPKPTSIDNTSDF